MTPEQVLALIKSVVTVAATAVKLGQAAAPYVEIIKNDILGKKLTVEEGEAIEAKILELATKALAPLDPAEPDEV